MTLFFELPGIVSNMDLHDFIAKTLSASDNGANRKMVGSLSGSSGPTRLNVPDYDPSGSAAKAMKLYEKNGDGHIAGEELDKAPGLKAAFKTTDANSDYKISEQQITDRIADCS